MKLKPAFIITILILFMIFHCCIYTSIGCFLTKTIQGKQPVYCVGCGTDESYGHVWVMCDGKFLEPSTLNLYHYKNVQYEHPAIAYTTTKDLTNNVDLLSPFYIDWKLIKTKLKSIVG